MPDPPRRTRTLLFLLLFLVSGATALVYQIVWIRELRVVLGSTIYSSSVVIATYMLGLMLGALSTPMLLRRVGGAGRLVRLYAVVEFGIAAFGFASIAILRGVDGIYIAWIRSGVLQDSLTLQMFVAFGVLLVPTFLMGTTLPLLVEVFSSLRTPSPQRWLGLLYGLNTFGAAVGAALAGFVLIPALGLSATARLGAVGNVAIGLAFLLLARASVLRTGPAAALPETAPAIDARARAPLGAVLGACLLFGVCSLSLEILYLRFLLPIIGISTFTASTVISTFIAALGLGSALGPRLLGSGGDPRVAFGRAGALIALLLALEITWMDDVPMLFASLFLGLGRSFESAAIAALLCAALVIFPVIFLFGATFPLFVSWHNREGMPLSLSTAWIYSTGTLGNVAGAVAAPFLLIPVLGMQWSFLAIAAVVLLSAICALARSFSPSALVAVGLAIAMLPIAWQPWDQNLVWSGAYYKVRGFRAAASSEENWKRIRDSELAYLREGPSATVSVLQRDGTRILHVNGKPVASNVATDLRVQYFLALLPFLLQGRRDSGLVVGLGTGVTCGTLALTTRSVDCVELSEEVVRATDLFTNVNFAPAERDNVNIVFEDGRKFVRTHSRLYDVISSDPIHPWAAGSSALYSVEYFESAKALLAPDGMLTQWLPLYEMSTWDIRNVLRTLAEVFPYVYVWNSTDSVVLIGRHLPLELRDLSHWPEPLPPEVEGILAGFGVERPVDVLAGFSADHDSLEQPLAGVAPNTEDEPILEFSAPRSLYRNTVPENLFWFTSLREGFEPRSLVLASAQDPSIEPTYASVTQEITGWAWERQQDTGRAAEAYLKAIEACPRCAHARIDGVRMVRSLRAEGALGKAAQLLRRLDARGVDPLEEWRGLGAQSVNAGRFRDAVRAFRHVTRSGEARADDFVNLGAAHQALGHPEPARVAFAEALRLEPEHAAARHNLDLLDARAAAE